MTQSTYDSKENDALAAFAGLIILIVILAIIFGLTTPNVVNGSNVLEETNDEVVVTDEATEESVVVEATEESVVVEVTEVSLVAETTQEPVVTDEATEESVVIAETTVEVEGVASSDVVYDPELVARGEQLFITCAACHGLDGQGIPGLGKDLIAGEFATTATDEELVTVVTMGRPIWDAANTTMVDMPPKGGNPTLTSDDIHAIVAYIRSLQTP